MDSTTRFRVIAATFIFLAAVGSIRLIASGGPMLGIAAAIGLWIGACLSIGFLVNRAIHRMESRRFHD
jgi:hypothetical protein